VYLVIIAGGVVRCTGSGMGCPDWPKCFGRWIPPTEESQLPTNFEEIYSNNGHLTVEFNVYKTWTEYLNRLLGVFVGIFIIGTVYFSSIFIKFQKSIFYLSILALLLVILQGWLGAKVVSSNLSPYMISIHMFLALLILSLLILAYSLSSTYKSTTFTVNTTLIVLLTFAILISLIQIFLGSQVRQEMDLVAKKYLFQHRELWVNELGMIFSIHRLFAYLVVVFNAVISIKLWKSGFLKYASLVSSLVLIEFLSGLTLTYFGVLSYIQPVHLVISTILFGIQIFLIVIFVLNRELEIQQKESITTLE
jgi:cytochrome c oxidase assembly protein subunit 15